MLADKDVPLELDWSFESLIDLNFQNCQLLKHNFTDGLLFFFKNKRLLEVYWEKKERKRELFAVTDGVHMYVTS